MNPRRSERKTHPESVRPKLVHIPSHEYTYCNFTVYSSPSIAIVTSLASPVKHQIDPI